MVGGKILWDMLAHMQGLVCQVWQHSEGALLLWEPVAYVAFFALGAGAVPGLLVPEITPAKLRGRLQITYTLNRGSAFQEHTLIISRALNLESP